VQAHGVGLIGEVTLESGLGLELVRDALSRRIGERASERINRAQRIELAPRRGALALNDLTAGVRSFACEFSLEIERQLALGGFAGIDEAAQLRDIPVERGNAAPEKGSPRISTLIKENMIVAKNVSPPTRRTKSEPKNTSWNAITRRRNSSTRISCRSEAERRAIPPSPSGCRYAIIVIPPARDR
jgi:hypothetical protein